MSFDIRRDLNPQHTIYKIVDLPLIYEVTLAPCCPIVFLFS